MEPLTTRKSLRDHIAKSRADGRKIAFVPTMGALHEGHLDLVRAAQKDGCAVIISIFVNPTQFGPKEDFAKYPRNLDADIALLNTLNQNGDIIGIYAPTTEEIYPIGDQTRVKVLGVTERWEGQFRPHFFEGVATVVSRLFCHVGPDYAYFGQKDYQQLQTIMRMTQDFGMDINIIGVPTRRDENGLALSSRNQYLSPADIKIASQLNKIISQMAQDIREGLAINVAQEKAHGAIINAGFDRIDYCAATDAKTLEPLTQFDGTNEGRILVAAWLSGTRLIDNLPI